jgi:hypothetical protein
MRFLLKTLIAATALASLVSVGSTGLALGGDKEGNGGDVVVNQGKTRFLDRMRKPKQTYFDLESTGWIAPLNRALLAQPGYAETTYFPGFSGSPMSMHDKILSALRSLNFYFVSGPIPPANDRGDVVLTWKISGSIQRLALQEEDSRKVFVDEELFDALALSSTEDVLAFLLHEALIRVYNDDRIIASDVPLTDISNIAALVYATFPGDQSGQKKLSARTVANYLCEAKIPAGIGPSQDLKLIENMTSVNAIYSDEVVAFAMDGQRCEVMKWRRLGSREGSGTNKFREWTFIDITEERNEANVSLLYYISEYEKRNPGVPTLAYTNFRSGAISPLSLMPYETMSILRIYQAPEVGLQGPGPFGIWPSYSGKGIPSQNFQVPAVNDFWRVPWPRSY